MLVRYSRHKRVKHYESRSRANQEEYQGFRPVSQIIGFIKDVKLQELLEEIDRLEWELDEKENPLSVFHGFIFPIPVALFCWWLVYKLFFS